LTEEQLSMRIQLFLSAILFGCLLEVQSKSFLIETEDAGSKQPDEFAAVRRNLPEGKESDSEELTKKIEQVVTELKRISADEFDSEEIEQVVTEFMRISADDDGDGNDYSGIPKRRGLVTLGLAGLAGLIFGRG